MRKNFRNKKYTSRVKPITTSEINKLRQTALKKVRENDYKRRKFLESKQFDKRIRQNIKENRFKQNVSNIKKIAKLGDTKEREKVLGRLFGEQNRFYGGRDVKVNSFTSLAQTKKLARILKLYKEGKFNIKRYVARKKQYQENKKHLPQGHGFQEILGTLIRTEFYYENRDIILKHNSNVRKHGKIAAEEMKEGKKLRDLHWENLNDDDADLLSQLGVI